MENPQEQKYCTLRKCITSYELFQNLCLDSKVQWEVSIKARCDMRVDGFDFSPASYRKAAYRQYILWQCERLGRGGRRVCLSCVVRMLAYPSADGNNMGFDRVNLMCQQGETCYFLFGRLTVYCILAGTGHSSLKLNWIFYFSTLKNCIAFVWKCKKWNRSTGVSCKSNLYRNNAGLWPKNAAECICRQLVNLRVAFLDLKICAVLLDIQHRSENHLFIGTYI